MINVHTAEVQLSDSLTPEVFFTASFPLVKHGTDIPETEGLTEEQVLQKLARAMLEQVFDTINENKLKYKTNGTV